MTAIVNVFLKEGVLDPQGKAVHHALGTLGYKGVSDIRVGKQIVLQLEQNDREAGLEEVRQMCETVLANTVIEDYRIEII